MKIQGVFRAVNKQTCKCAYMQIGKCTTCHRRLKMVNIKKIGYKIKYFSFSTYHDQCLDNIYLENSFCIDLV